VAVGHGEKADPNLYQERRALREIFVKKTLPPFYRKVIIGSEYSIMETAYRSMRKRINLM
jgi:hypothetical protein